MICKYDLLVINRTRMSKLYLSLNMAIFLLRLD